MSAVGLEDARDAATWAAGPVHFIWLGGRFLPQHERAIRTARIHGMPVWLWISSHAQIPAEVARWHSDAIDGLRELPVQRWLQDHPIQLANVKDLFVWRILREHGGLYLDLDTISLAPVWDLLTRDVLVSEEWEPGFEAGPRYNSAVVAARPGAPVLEVLELTAESLLVNGETRWGACGPWLLTACVPDYPDSFDTAPMPLLNGWRDDTIHRYYDGEKPPEGTRVIHLYSSSRPERFAADTWKP